MVFRARELWEYEIAPHIFWELGHEVVSINDKPNGKNIN